MREIKRFVCEKCGYSYPPVLYVYDSHGMAIKSSLNGKDSICEKCFEKWKIKNFSTLKPIYAD